MSAVKALEEEDGRYTVEEITSKVGISEDSDQKFGNEKRLGPRTRKSRKYIVQESFSKKSKTVIIG